MKNSAPDLTMNPVARQDLHWIRTGNDKPETIVLIHPVGLDLTYWGDQIAALLPDYDVIAFDLPGHGSSEARPEDIHFDYVVEAVRTIATVAERDSVHLVGISVGGMIAQATALQYPTLVRSLTLIATASTFPNAARDAMRARAETIRSNGMSAILQATLERWFTSETIKRRPDLIHRVSETLLACRPEIQANMWDMISHFDVHERLADIHCPTLVLAGDVDPSTPPAMNAAIANAIAGAELVVLNNTSHMAMLESAEPVSNEIRRFLRSVALR